MTRIMTFTIILLIFTAIVFPWMLLAGSMAVERIELVFSENPGKPEITYGEFPFTLVYEINGEEKVIEDTIVCEYDGIEIGRSEKVRQWDGYIKSTRSKHIQLLDLKNLNEETDYGPSVSLCFDWGFAAYYMDDSVNYNRVPAQYLNNLLYLYRQGDLIVEHIISAEEAFDRYGVRLISWECAPPIENEFK